MEATALEVLKDEQERLLLKQMGELLLRQNSKKKRNKPFTHKECKAYQQHHPTIEQPSQSSQPMDVEAQAQTQSAPTTQAQTQSAPTAPTVSNQSTQLNTELQQRRNIATQRQQAVVMNHRGEIFQQKQTDNNRTDTSHQSTQKLCTNKDHKTFLCPIVMMLLWKIQGTENEDKTYQAQAINPLPAVEMDVGASSKRGSPETQVEPRGKAG